MLIFRPRRNGRKTRFELTLGLRVEGRVNPFQLSARQPRALERRYRPFFDISDEPTDLRQLLHSQARRHKCLLRKLCTLRQLFDKILLHRFDVCFQPVQAFGSAAVVRKCREKGWHRHHDGDEYVYRAALHNRLDAKLVDRQELARGMLRQVEGGICYTLPGCPIDINVESDYDVRNRDHLISGRNGVRRPARNHLRAVLVAGGRPAVVI